MIAQIKAEPAVVIGLAASIVVAVAQQILASGLVSSAGAVNLLNVVVSLVPILAGILIRAFVSPASDPAPAAPAAPSGPVAQ